ncbi:hypothetical protein HPB48_008772 [Haemaphysalis longicornis]|uniref:Reverse transcriptase n=1 Tax=Haemaphysalis longicornis TaxID=44386 RepID=A0A9J6GUS5_HAELO|nr:hypothetical protein HPB48_008772 [Haemaphysalis longicornis]
MAPNYATIFMHNIETKFLSSDSALALHKRFLDDIFLMWRDTEERRIAFIQEINQVHPRISFTYEYFHTKISFLDVGVVCGTIPWRRVRTGNRQTVNSTCTLTVDIHLVV